MISGYNTLEQIKDEGYTLDEIDEMEEILGDNISDEIDIKKIDEYTMDDIDPIQVKSYARYYMIQVLASLYDYDIDFDYENSIIIMECSDIDSAKIKFLFEFMKEEYNSFDSLYLIDYFYNIKQSFGELNPIEVFYPAIIVRMMIESRKFIKDIKSKFNHISMIFDSKSESISIYVKDDEESECYTFSMGVRRHKDD